jgi:hypothetical protein
MGLANLTAGRACVLASKQRHCGLGPAHIAWIRQGKGAWGRCVGQRHRGLGPAHIAGIRRARGLGAAVRRLT